MHVWIIVGQIVAVTLVAVGYAAVGAWYDARAARRRLLARGAHPHAHRDLLHAHPRGRDAHHHLPDGTRVAA